MHGALRLSLGGTAFSRHDYLIAARRLVCDAFLPPLLPFTVPVDHRAVLRPQCADPTGHVEPIHCNEGWVGGRFVEVRSERAGGAYVVRVAGLPPVLVERGGCAVLTGSLAAAPGELLIEALLGPCLILALAINGQFTLHASAVSVDGTAALLVGASGAGKSTLARALAGAGAVRLADDVLPCDTTPDGIEALPHYPQLKLSAAEQYGAALAPRAPVRAIYVLDGCEDADDAVTIEPLAARDALLTIAANTVVARLFDAALLDRHLEFCGAAAAAVSVRRVRFRRGLELLPRLAAAVRDDAAALR